MRWSSVAVVLLFLPLAGSAQSDEALAEDDGRDVEGTGLAANAPAPDMEGALDLISLDIEERPLEFLMRLTVAELPPTGTAGEINVEYLIQFRHGDAQFQASVYRYGLGGGAAQYRGSIDGYDEGTGRYRAMQEVDATASGNTIEVSVARALLRDGTGTAPSPGRVLEDFVVTSIGNDIGRPCLPECLEPTGWGDRMPNDGFAARVHEVIYGVKQTGSARLSSQEPFRASNGEATTFVYQVNAANVGDEEDLFRFNTSGAPDKWDVQVPPQSLRLAPGANISVPIIVRTPFAHSHGSATSFILELQSVRDSQSVGRLEMGVFYPSPPQPAGHHDTLWLHTVDLSDDPATLALAAATGMLGSQGMLQNEYMNTLEEDDRADEVPSEGESCSIYALDPDYPVGSGYCWEFPLDPGLLMGLDFDLARSGTLEFIVGSQLPLPGASVEGRLVFMGPPEGDYPPGYPVAFMQRETVPLATINRSAMQDIGALGTATFTLDVVPTPESDRIPYQPGGALALELQVNTLRPENFYLGPRTPPPTIAGGARMELPLNEYEDEVEEIVEFASGLVLDGKTDLRRLVNPGKTVVFKAVLTNGGSEEGTFRLGLIGSNREWARMLGPAQIQLAPGQTHEIALAVSPPADIVAGNRADLVLEAASEADIQERALLRFLAVVADHEDIPDESHIADSLSESPAKKSPGLALWMLLGALLVLVRRRH